jgi:hypothetical protein
MNELLIEYRPNGTAHNDIFLRLGEYSCIADSYYFDLDVSDDPHPSVEKVLIQLLGQWLKALNEADSTEPVFLPYDFSDQFTRCLRCIVSVTTIEVQSGWSNREGWRTSPSSPEDYFYSIEDFHPEMPEPVQLQREDFLMLINQSIAQAQKQLEMS